MPQLPPDLSEDNDGPLLSHDTFCQVVRDVVCSRSAVSALASLLHAGDPPSGPGLAVLLESAEARMTMALDGLRDAAYALRIEGAEFPDTAPA